MYSFDLGTFRCAAVSDGSFDYAPEMFFENAAAEEVAGELRRIGSPPDRITTPYTSLVIDTGSARVLVDLGGGALGPRTGRLPTSLRKAGYPPESIDIVIVTHAHPDHVGGTLDEAGELLCPKARFVITRREWEFWFSPEAESVAAHAVSKAPTSLVDIARRNLSAMEERVELLDRDTELLPGISVLHAPGHTPGHAVVASYSKGEKLLYTADTVLSPLHLEHPDWLPAVDLLPEEADKSKRRIYGKASAENWLVMAQHFPPFPSLGYVRRQETGWRWEPMGSAAMPRSSRSIFPTLVLVAGLMIAVPIAVGAQTVSYVEGMVEIRGSGEPWHAVEIGDRPGRNAQIRLGDEGYLELSTASGRLTLWQAGEYRVAEITDAGRSRNEAGFGSLLRDRMRTLTGDSSARQAGNHAGVRGAEAADGPSISWAGAPTAEELISQGIARLEREGPEAALVSFQEAQQVAGSDPAWNRASFYAGYTYSLAGEPRAAIEELRSAALPTGSALEAERILTLGQLYVEVFAYREAISLMRDFLEQADRTENASAGSSRPQRRQQALLVLGLAQQGLEREAAARDTFRRIRDLDPETEAAQIAAHFLSELH